MAGNDVGIPCHGGFLHDTDLMAGPLAGQRPYEVHSRTRLGIHDSSQRGAAAERVPHLHCGVGLGYVVVWRRWNALVG